MHVPDFRLGSAARSLLPLSAALLLLAACPSPKPVPDGPDTATPEADAGSATKEDQSALEREYRQLALRNGCPKGYESIQGRWRFIGTSRTPELDDRLEIAGTRFVEKIRGRPGGELVEATLRGEVRCLFKNRVLFIVDEVTPPGAFDNQPGDAYPCDVLEAVDGDRDRFLMICFFDFDVRPVKGKEFEYGRDSRPWPAE